MNKEIVRVNIPDSYRPLVADERIKEAIETFYPYFCLYMSDRDPVGGNDILLEGLEAVDEGPIVMEITQAILDEVDGFETYFSGDVEMDYSIEINTQWVDLGFHSRPHP